MVYAIVNMYEDDKSGFEIAGFNCYFKLLPYCLIKLT
jgi:hypothetical protein